MALHAGCATASASLPLPPPDAARNAIHTVAVVSAGTVLGRPAAPPTDLGRAASAGAKLGVQSTLVVLGWGGGLLLPIAVPAGALIGMAVYAARSPSDAERAASTAALTRFFEQFDVQDELRAQAARFVHDHARRMVRPPIDHTTASAPGERGAPETVAADVDAVIEVIAESVELVQVLDFGELGVVLVGRARLIGRADGRELYAASLTYRAGARPLTEWTRDDCQALRQELVRASQMLAERMVDEIFLVEGYSPR